MVAGERKRLRVRRSRFPAERFSSAADRYRPRRNRSRPKRPIKANVPTRTAIIPEDMAGAAGATRTSSNDPLRLVHVS